MWTNETEMITGRQEDERGSRVTVFFVLTFQE